MRMRYTSGRGWPRDTGRRAVCALVAALWNGPDMPMILGGQLVEVPLQRDPTAKGRLRGSSEFPATFVTVILARPRRPGVKVRGGEERHYGRRGQDGSNEHSCDLRGGATGTVIEWMHLVSSRRYILMGTSCPKVVSGSGRRYAGWRRRHTTPNPTKFRSAPLWIWGVPCSGLVSSSRGFVGSRRFQACRVTLGSQKLWPTDALAACIVASSIIGVQKSIMSEAAEMPPDRMRLCMTRTRLLSIERSTKIEVH